MIPCHMNKKKSVYNMLLRQQTIFGSGKGYILIKMLCFFGTIKPQDVFLQQIIKTLYKICSLASILWSYKGLV